MEEFEPELSYVKGTAGKLSHESSQMKPVMSESEMGYELLNFTIGFNDLTLQKQSRKNLTQVDLTKWAELAVDTLTWDGTERFQFTTESLRTAHRLWPEYIPESTEERLLWQNLNLTFRMSKELHESFQMKEMREAGGHRR